MKINCPIPGAFSIRLLACSYFAVVFLPQASSDGPRSLYSRGSDNIQGNENLPNQPTTKDNGFAFLTKIVMPFYEGLPKPQAFNEPFQGPQGLSESPPLHLASNSVSRVNLQDSKAANTSSNNKKYYIIGGAILILVIIGSILIWWFCFKKKKPTKWQKNLMTGVFQEALQQIPTEELIGDNLESSDILNNPMMQTVMENEDLRNNILESAQAHSDVAQAVIEPISGVFNEDDQTIWSKAVETAASQLGDQAMQAFENKFDKQTVENLDNKPNNVAIRSLEVRQLNSGSQPIDGRSFSSGNQPLDARRLNSGSQPVDGKPMNSVGQPVDGRSMNSRGQPLDRRPMNAGNQSMYERPLTTRSQPLEGRPPNPRNQSFERKPINPANQQMDGAFEMDRALISRCPRKRYDSDSTLYEVDPRRREHYVREYDRGYDSDRSNHGQEPRMPSTYVLPRLDSDKRVYNNDHRRINHRNYEDNRRDYSPKRGMEPQLVRRTDSYDNRIAPPPERYGPSYDSSYNQRPSPRYDPQMEISNHGAYVGQNDYNVSTIKDRRYKDPYSREVRHELGAMISNSSFSKNDYSKNPYETRMNNEVPYYHLPETYVEKYPPHKRNVPDHPPSFPLPKPDYQSEKRIQPPKVHPKPVVKPREFKGPYGPDDLDEMNNPYTWSKGKGRKLALDDK